MGAEVSTSVVSAEVSGAAVSGTTLSVFATASAVVLVVSVDDVELLLQAASDPERPTAKASAIASEGVACVLLAGAGHEAPR